MGQYKTLKEVFMPEEQQGEPEVLLAESEVYVDAEGNARDDEGNSWFVGLRYANGTYRASELPAGHSGGPRRDPGPSSRPYGGSRRYRRRR